ncbi:MAG: flagellar basal body L-ring protein FlgH [Massilia sp.]
MTGIKWPKLAMLCAALLALTGAQADSLYKPKSFQALTSDRKAAAVGDLLTVQVFESATATTSADTSSRRKNNISASLVHGKNDMARAALATSGDFDGGGRTERTNRFLTTLTVKVRDVYPNGDLQVEGEEVLSVDDERQTIHLVGRVRTADISDTNVVLSTRLADANITLVGDGALSDRQRRAWWRRAMDWLGL